MHRGMDYVTITDHDTIAGAQDIAHLDNVIVGEEVTCYFPEDRARIHVVVLDIDEPEHRIIQSLRMNIYELTAYLNAQKILHFVAHPFFRMTTALTLAHFEKLMILFKCFEVRNGGKLLWPDQLLENLLAGLDFEMLYKLADQYNLEPRGEEPWIKYQVAGSDDHGGILVGSPHTRLPIAGSRNELLKHIREGRTESSEEGGSPLAVAHSILSVAFHHFERMTDNRQLKSRIIWNLAGQIFNNVDPDRMLNFPARIMLFLNEQLDLFGAGSSNRNSGLFVRELARLVKSHPEFRQFLSEGFEFNHENNEKLFEITSTLIHNSLVRVLRKSGEQSELKQVLKRIRELRLVITVMLVYLIGFRTEYRDRPLMREVRRKYCADDNQDPEHIAVFTDGTSREVVHHLVLKNYRYRTLSRNARIYAFGLSEEEVNADDRENHKSLCQFKIKSHSIGLPPFLNILKRFFDFEFQHIYLHSFGSMGILGLCTGKLLGIPVTAMFPRATFDASLYNMAADGFERFPLMLVKMILKHADHVTVTTPEDMEYLLTLHIPMERIDLLQPSRKKFNVL